MKQSAMFKLAMIAALILSQVTSQVAQASSLSPTPAASYATRYWAFDVTVQGSASGNSFQRACQLVVTQGINSPGTTNGRNPYDVALVCGNPWQRQERGAITYTTNTALLGGAQQLDMATVSYDRSNSMIGITVDSRIAATGLNVFTVSSSLLSMIYTVQTGRMSVLFSETGQSVAGYINFSGPAYYSLGSGSYVAQFQGRLSRTGTF